MERSQRFKHPYRQILNPRVSDRVLPPVIEIILMFGLIRILNNVDEPTPSHPCTNNHRSNFIPPTTSSSSPSSSCTLSHSHCSHYSGTHPSSQRVHVAKGSIWIGHKQKGQLGWGEEDTRMCRFRRGSSILCSRYGSNSVLLNL